MKQSLLLLFTFLILFACKNEQTNNTNNSTDANTDLVEMIKNPTTASTSTNPDELPKMDFEKDEHDFGTIQDGEKVQYSFKFKNNGKIDLLIASANGSCGCTVPNYPKKPIAPGDEGVIDVTFDSKGKQGMQNKTITLITNCIPSTKVLTIMGNVTPAKTQ